MPANVVKTPAQEKAWERAKRRVRSQYPNINEGTPRFYKLVMTIFKNMVAEDRPPKTKLQEAMQEA